jgi:hypothetical protein
LFSELSNLKFWGNDNIDFQARLLSLPLLFWFVIYSLYELVCSYPIIDALQTKACRESFHSTFGEANERNQSSSKESKEPDRKFAERLYSEGELSFVLNFNTKQKYVRYIGVVILVCDLFLLMLKHSFTTNIKCFYLGYMELIIASIFLGMFIIRDSNITIAGLLFSMIAISLLNSKIIYDEDFFNNSMIIFNCLLGSCFILKYWEVEAKENFEGKRLLEEKEENLKEILNLFPSAILFYNPKNGIIYKNRHFKEIIENIIQKLDEKLESKCCTPSKKWKVNKLKNVFEKWIDCQDDKLHSCPRLLSNFMNKDDRCRTLSDDIKSLFENK